MIKNKKTLQDVVPPKKSIQNIPLPDDKIKKTGKARRSAKSAIGFFGSFKAGRSTRSGFGKKFWAIAILLIMAGSVFLSFMSSSVVITIVPKQWTQRVDASFIAVSKNEIGGVPFDIMMLDETGAKSVPVASEEEVLEQASGQIIIFNDYSSANQRLMNRTRFETPEGLVYRINKSVTVPGQTKNIAGKIIPGSAEVTVYADHPGEEYNIGLFDFIIPGFEGDPRFDKFYARSKTAMTGGFNGVRKIASEEDVENARLELRAELTQKLTQDIRSQIPVGFLLYNDGLFVKSDFVGTADLENSVSVQEKVSVYAVILNQENLSKYVAENTLDAYRGEPLIVSNLSDLEFEIKNKEDATPWTEGRFVFSLKGKADFEWLFDEEQLKNDFVGQSKKDADAILVNYGSIEFAGIEIRPFWKNSFPRSTGKIEIIKKLEK